VRERQPEPIRDAMAAAEAFDESRPIPESALAALDYMNRTAQTIARYEWALRRIAGADYRGNRSLLSQIAWEALHPEGEK
jgi:Ser/Thr protein kinase RdoA (MazF antagonist)